MMNAHKMTILLLMLWTTSAFVHGQDVVTQMNSIKLDKSYVYGQATHENADTAYMEALNDLILSIEARTKEKVDVKQVRTKAQKLSRQRGNRVQVMVYVKVEEKHLLTGGKHCSGGKQCGASGKHCGACDKHCGANGKHCGANGYGGTLLKANASTCGSILHQLWR